MAGETQQGVSNLVPEGADFRTVACASDFLDIEIDQSAMWIGPLPITDGSEDREGDRIDPNGLIVSSYQTNPVVFWNHSHQIDGQIPAIGIAANRDKSFGVFRNGDAWFSPTLFSQSLPLASQTFHLICEGIIRTRSVGALPYDLTPITPSVPMVGLHEGRAVVNNPVSSYYRTAELIEFSWTNISCNRGMTIDQKIALKSLMSRPRLNGERWDGFLLKSLRSSDLRENKSFPGWGSGAKAMSGPIVGVLFDASVPAGTAHKFLQTTGELHDGNLTIDSETGCLKSVQVEYDGPVVCKSVPGAPLIRLLHANTQSSLPRGGSILKAFGKPDDLRAEADAVQSGAAKPPAQMQQAPVAQNPPAQPQPPAAPAKKPPVQPGAQPANAEAPAHGGAEDDRRAIDMVAEALTTEDDQPLSGPAGSQHVQGLVRALTKLLRDSDASIADVEHPDVRAAHGSFRDLATKAVSELSRLHDATYQGHEGVTVKMCADCDEEAAAEEPAEEQDPAKKQAAVMKSHYRSEVFRGHRSRVPVGVMRALMSPLVVKSVAPAAAVAPVDTEKRERLLAEARSLGLFSEGLLSGIDVSGLGPRRS